MATFTFTAFPLAITITVRGVSSGDVVRFFVRTDPGNVTIIDEQHTATSTSITRTFEGLEERTDYAVNAGVVTGNSTDWIGYGVFYYTLSGRRVQARRLGLVQLHRIRSNH